MHVIQIPLEKNPELAALLADKEPGAKIDLHTSIKDKDGQTVSLTLEECSEGAEAESDDDESEDEKTDDTPAPKSEPEKPKKTYGRQVLDAMGSDE